MINSTPTTRKALTEQAREVREQLKAHGEALVTAHRILDDNNAAVAPVADLVGSIIKVPAITLKQANPLEDTEVLLMRSPLGRGGASGDVELLALRNAAAALSPLVKMGLGYWNADANAFAFTAAANVLEVPGDLEVELID